jgi:acetyl esterase/lipase
MIGCLIRKAGILGVVMCVSFFVGCGSQQSASSSSISSPSAPIPDKTAITPACSLPSQNNQPALPTDAAHTDTEHYRGTTTQADEIDYYFPANTGPNTPMVLIVHGGAWTSYGDTTGDLEDAAYLVHQGYAAANVNYRLTGGTANLFPTAVQDLRCAVRFMRAHATTRYSPKILAALGGSAGGNLVSMLGVLPPAYNDPTLPFQDLGGACANFSSQNSNVDAVAAYYPAVNVTSSLDYDTTPPPQSQPGNFTAWPVINNFATYTGIAAGQVFANPAVEIATPEYYLSQGLVKTAANFYIVNGDQDNQIPEYQSGDLRDAVKKYTSSSATWELVPGQGHGFVSFDTSNPEIASAACNVLSFYAAHLPSPTP